VSTTEERERKQQASSAQVDVVADRLQREFLLVSALSGAVSGSGTWFVDSGATCHMTGAWELFESFTESDSDLYVELGMGTKHAVQGSGTMSFRMESGDVLRVTNVLWVPKLRKSVLSVSTIEEKGYAVLFEMDRCCSCPEDLAQTQQWFLELERATCIG
jgi:hypothetical protein